MLGTINPEILFLQQEDQIKAGLLDMKMILKITEDTYKMLGQGQIQNPPKVHLGIPEGTEWESFFNTMPSYIGGDMNIAGIKWAAESKKNTLELFRRLQEFCRRFPVYLFGNDVAPAEGREV